MPINSRAKGRRGELEIRDILKDITGTEWIRTPLSGGLHLSFPWDVMPKPGSPPTILDGVGQEVKNTVNLKIPEWIEQCKEAEKDFVGFSKNRWALWFKRKGEWYVTIPYQYYAHLLTEELP